MKVTCPECRAVIPAGDLSLDAGWGKCAVCDEVFPLEGLLPGYQIPQRSSDASAVERPFDAVTQVRRQRDVMLIHRPAEGMRAGTWGVLAFATFWTGFVAFWTAGALGLFNGAGPPKIENAIFAAFSTPFWLVGLGMLGTVAWMARGTRTVRIDAGEMHTELRCPPFGRRKAIEREQVQFARMGTATAPSNRPDTCLYSAEIVFRGGSFKIPCDTPAEQEWLIAEINSFLKSVPYRSGMSQVDSRTPLWDEPAE